MKNIRNIYQHQIGELLSYIRKTEKPDVSQGEIHLIEEKGNYQFFLFSTRPDLGAWEGYFNRGNRWEILKTSVFNTYPYKEEKLPVFSFSMLDLYKNYRLRTVKAYLKEREMRGKTQKGTPIKPEDFPHVFASYEWGSISGWKKGAKPTFYLPKWLDLSKITLKGKYGFEYEFFLIHNVDVICDTSDTSTPGIGGFFSLTRPKFKFRKGEQTIAVSYKELPYIPCKSYTITNGGGHRIYVYLITNHDLRKAEKYV